MTMALFLTTTFCSLLVTVSVFFFLGTGSLLVTVTVFFFIGTGSLTTRTIVTVAMRTARTITTRSGIVATILWHSVYKKYIHYVLLDISCPGFGQ